jgi:hypothetical protein
LRRTFKCVQLLDDGLGSHAVDGALDKIFKGRKRKALTPTEKKIVEHEIGKAVALVQPATWADLQKFDPKLQRIEQRIPKKAVIGRNVDGIDVRQRQFKRSVKKTATTKTSKRVKR